MAEWATWAHGNAFSAERTTEVLQQVDGRAYSDVVGAAFGWGRAFRFKDAPRVDDFFHVTVPTPTFDEDKQLFLDAIHVLWTSSPGCGVIGVHAWDAGNRFFVWAADNLEVPSAGDWSTFAKTVPAGRSTFREARTNFWTPRDSGNRHFVGLGLGISVKVTSGGPDRQITFHGAGARWVDAPQ